MAMVLAFSVEKEIDSMNKLTGSLQTSKVSTIAVFFQNAITL
jgi:hypothetical protein